MGKASNRKKGGAQADTHVQPRDPRPLEAQTAGMVSDAVAQAMQRPSVAGVVELVARMDDAAERSSAGAASFVQLRRYRGEPVPKMACRAGCALCCHVRVSALPIEIVAIAEFVRRRFPVGQREALMERVRAHNEQSRAMTPLERSRSVRPCPFLEENQCSIYEARPLACRAHHSVSYQACEDAFAGRGNGAIPVLREHHSSIKPIIAGAYHGLRRAGGREQDLEFVPALEIALEEPDACERWVAGEDVFASAVDSEQAEARRKPTIA